jgi:hypothetical protein
MGGEIEIGLAGLGDGQGRRQADRRTQKGLKLDLRPARRGPGDCQEEAEKS